MELPQCLLAGSRVHHHCVWGWGYNNKNNHVKLFKPMLLNNVLCKKYDYLHAFYFKVSWMMMYLYALCIFFPSSRLLCSFWAKLSDRNKCEAKTFLHVKVPMPKGMEHFQRIKSKLMETCSNQYVIRIYCKDIYWFVKALWNWKETKPGSSCGY